MRRFVAIFLVAAIMACDLSFRAEGQNQECMNRLMPCVRYLNGTRDPPSSCCDPLRDVIRNMPECLCAMVSIQGSNQAQKAGININDAQMLPARCGQRVNYIGCVQGSRSNGSVSFGLPSVITVAFSLFVVHFLWQTIS